MDKNFLHTDIRAFKISRFRFISGLVIGLLFSFSFYAFLYLFRETFRVLSVFGDHQLWILSDSAVDFYNLFFAFVSVIFGQAICFILWFDKPKRFFGRFNYRKTTIINDQRVLNIYFLSWFSKLAVVFGIFFLFSLNGGFYALQLYPDYNYLFILIVIVLFFQNWNTIRLTFKKDSLKWLYSSIIIISVISLGFSKINLVDYKTINENYKQNNIHLRYDIELPKSNIYQKLHARTWIKEFYVVHPQKTRETSKSLILYNNNEIGFDELFDSLNDWQSKYDEFLLSNLICQIHIDRNTRMDFVNELKRRISRANIRKIAYSIIPKDSNFNKNTYQNYALVERIPNYDSDLYKSRMKDFQGSNKINVISIKPIEADEFFVENEQISAEKLKGSIKTELKKEPGSLIELDIDNDTKLYSYIWILSATKSAINELRNDYALIKFSKKYINLNATRQNKIKMKYPYILTNDKITEIE